MPGYIRNKVLPFNFCQDPVAFGTILYVDLEMNMNGALISTFMNGALIST